MVSEYFHPWVDDVGAASFIWSMLGAMVQATNKIELMTGVTTPLFRYHSAMVAQAAGTMDRLSGGRFLLGVGTGENINEGPLGYEFPAYKERSERMREALKPWRGLRAPGRLEAVDPEELRKKADKMDRSDILSRYSVVSTVGDYVKAYSPLVAELGADIIVIQSTGVDQEKVIELLGKEIIPKVKKF